MDFAGYETLKFAREGRILRVTINRPDTYNAVNAAMHAELARVFYDLNRDPLSDVIILTGAGKAFCAGGDTDWFQRMIDNPSMFEELVPEAKSIVFGLLELEKPIICRLNGAAAGLGATIALFCDIVIASERAVIGDPHVKMGLVAGDGGCVIWPQLIGFNKAKEFLMTGEMLRATEAERIGLVNYVVPADALDEKTDEMAARLVQGARQAIRWTKTTANIALRELAQKIMDAGLAYEQMSNLTQDHQEATTAFIEKREPKFKGC